MNRFNFESSFYDADGTEKNHLNMSFSGDCTLSEVLENFENFLRGTGYYFDGHLDFVEDEVNANHFDDESDRWLEEQYYESEEPMEYKVSDEWKWTVNEIAKHAK